MYKIIGADEKEYGPVSEDQIRQWLVEGRVNSKTKIKSETSPDWQQLGALPEFASASVPTLPPSLITSPASSKTSGMAITSLVLGVLGFCGITALIGLILGIIALVKINRSEGRLGGRGFAIAGICVSGFMLLCIPILAGLTLPALAKAKAKAQSIQCINNVKQLNIAVIMYASDSNEVYPSAATWCDTLQKYIGSTTPLLCPRGDASKRCHYAFNAKLDGITGTKITDPGRTVLFFETDGGWNLSGGPELMLKHSRHGRAIPVGFADGHAEMVTETRQRELRWDP